MRLTALLIVALPTFASAEVLECQVITKHMDSAKDARSASLRDSEQKAQAVKDAINSILVDPRMPADLATEARQEIFGKAFEDWQASLASAWDNTLYPDDPLFDALMHDKCG